MGDPDLKLLIGVIIVIALGVVGWIYRDDIFGAPGPEPAIELPATVEPDTQTGPKYPVPVMPTDDSGPRSLVPLPPLDDSDAYFLLAIASSFGPAIESLLVREHPSRRTLARQLRHEHRRR